MNKNATPEGTKQYYITKIITNPDLVAYQNEADGFKKGKKILFERKGCTLIPIGHGGGMGLMAVPYCYLEYACTAQEFATWKFTQNLQP